MAQIPKKTERCIATLNDIHLYTYLHSANGSKNDLLLYKYFNSECLFLCLFPFKGNFQCGRLCFLAHSGLVWPRHMWHVNFVYSFMHLFMSVCRHLSAGIAQAGVNLLISSLWRKWDHLSASFITCPAAWHRHRFWRWLTHTRAHTVVYDPGSLSED